MKKVLEKLKKSQDKKYAEFQVKLIPTVDKKTIIGVRTPELKSMAKELLASCEIDVDKFLDELPHKYFDENQLHAFILSEIKDFDICIKRVNEFLPYIDNWATCDQLSPKCFKKNKKALFQNINKWLKSKKCYIVRFAIGCLMQYFLDEDFDKKYLKMVANVKFRARTARPYDVGADTIRSKVVRPYDKKISVDIDPDKYYVEMMRAWYFATALAKQYKDTLLYIKGKKLGPWTQNKTIQKACESYRVSDNHKIELKKYIVK